MEQTREAVDEMWRTADPKLVNDIADAIARGCAAYSHRLPVGCMTAITKSLLFTLEQRRASADA